MTTPLQSQVWIGNVEVLSSPEKAVLGKGLRGGFTLMMAWTHGRADFRRQVLMRCEELEVDLVRVTGVKPFAGDRKNTNLDLRLLSAAGEVAKTMKVWHGTFNSFPKNAGTKRK